MRSPLFAAVICAGLLGLAACSGGPSPSKPPTATPTATRLEATLFFSAELRGEIEPCGCTADPLGDLARLAGLIGDAQKTRSVALLDAGSLLYSELTPSADKREQERMKAQLIATALPRLGLVAAGLGAYDTAGGVSAITPPRQAANAPEGSQLPVEAPRVIMVGAVKVGVFGLTDAEALAPLGGAAMADPVATAKAQLAALRGQGAHVVVCLAQLDRASAKRLAKDAPGIDIIVAGKNTPDPKPGVTPSAIEQLPGGTVIVQPYQRGQSVVRVDLAIDPEAAAGVALVDAIGEARAKDRLASLDATIADLETKLAGWRTQPDADPSFLATKQGELDGLRQDRAALAAKPLRAPEHGSYFTSQHVLIKKAMRCDAEVEAQKRAFDRAAGEANLAAAKNDKPIPVPKGGSGYAGVEECADCHKAAVDFWKKTNHAHAWETLEVLGKQWNNDCINCHVTGWKEPGGSSFAENETLRDVQCEVCHGPAGTHVDSFGKDRSKLLRTPPQTRCVTCHSPEHSDTFDFTAYLRDVTGPGHGEAFRKALGDGPTGGQLRKAALEAAGKGKGEGCLK